MRRSVEKLKEGLNPKINLISFGPIGPELKNGFKDDDTDRSRIRNKLNKKGYENFEIDLIFDNINLVEVNEEIIKEEIISYLRKTHVGLNPDVAFDLLMNWIYVLSEKSGLVNKADLQDKLNNIASFLSEISSFLEEYGLSVMQLDLPEEVRPKEQLEEEFYIGISARYEHILANLDVKRPDKLDEIKKKIEENNVLIIHGASGQGKSTLAYRFLYEYYPIGLTYQIKSKDRDALRIIRTLHAISHSINENIAIYIDVEPGDITWTEIVKELYRYPKFHVFVTIREEDWTRSTLSGADLIPSEVELTLNKEEAEHIYENLTSKKPDRQFLDFEDSWLKFGGQGPLLEFTYLITQGSTLKEKLEAQIERIREESSETERLDFLRIISIIGMYGGKTDLKSVKSVIKLRDLPHAINLFQKEYLIRESGDGRYLEPLHPLRSKILVEILSNPILTPIEDDIATCLYIIDEKYLEIFLLNCFLKFGPHEKILGALESYIPFSWHGYGLIVKSLLWIGIKKYLDLNIDVINEAHDKFGSGWSLVLGADLSNAMDGDSDFIETALFPDERKEEAKSLRAKLKDKNLIYKFLKRWLIKSNIPSENPESNEDWTNLGLALFWLGKLEIEKDISFSNYEFDKYFDSIYLEHIADFILGLCYFDPTNDIIINYRPIITERFKKEFLVPSIEDDNKRICLHCIIDLTEADKFSKSKNNFVNELIMERLRLIRKLYPEREIFACKGYGNEFYLLKSDWDDTKKEIRAGKFPLDWLVTINSIFIHLADYNYRLDTWEEYVNKIVKTRENSLIIVKLLLKNLKKYFKTRKLINIFELNDLDNKLIDLTQNLEVEHFPKVAVDPLGFTSENIEQMEDEETKTNDQITQAVNLKKFNEYSKAYGDFITFLNNFYTQINDVNIFQCLSKGKKLKTIEVIKEDLEKKGIRTDFNRLSVINLHDAYKNLMIFQREFKTHFKKYASFKELEEDEIINYGILTEVWNIFALKRFELNKNIIKSVEGSFKNEKENISVDLIKSFKNKKLDVKLISKLFNNTKENYFIFNVSDPFKIFETIIKVIKTIKKELNGVLWTDLKKLFLDQEFEYFRIIVLVDNKLLLPISNNFPLFRALNQENDEIGILDLNSRLLEDKINNLEIEKWQDTIPEITELNKAFKIEGLHHLVYHLKQLTDIELDDIGLEITQNYVNKIIKEIQNAFQDVLDFFAFITNRLNTHINYLKEKYGNLEDSPEIDEIKEILELIQETHKKIFPNDPDGSERVELTINLNEMNDWYNRIQKGKDSLYALYLYYANDYISKYNN